MLGGTADTRVVYARTDAVAGGIKAPADIMKADTLAVGALSTTDVSGLLQVHSTSIATLRTRNAQFLRSGQVAPDVLATLRRSIGESAK